MSAFSRARQVFHLLAAGIDNLHRPPRSLGKDGGERLERAVKFEAEAAADRRHGNADPRSGDAKNARGDVAHGPRNLRRSLDMIAPIFVGRDRGARFETQMVLATDAKSALDDDDIRSGKGLVKIAADDRRLPGYIPRGRAPPSNTIS